MNIEELRAEKTKMDRAIREAASRAVADFKAATGMTPRSINVLMIGMSEIGARRQYQVGSVESDVDVLEEK